MPPLPLHGGVVMGGCVAGVCPCIYFLGAEGGGPRRAPDDRPADGHSIGHKGMRCGGEGIPPPSLDLLVVYFFVSTGWRRAACACAPRERGHRPPFPTGPTAGRALPTPPPPPVLPHSLPQLFTRPHPAPPHWPVLVGVAPTPMRGKGASDSRRCSSSHGISVLTATAAATAGRRARGNALGSTPRTFGVLARALPPSPVPCLAAMPHISSPSALLRLASFSVPLFISAIAIRLLLELKRGTLAFSLAHSKNFSRVYSKKKELPKTWCGNRHVDHS